MLLQGRSEQTKLARSGMPHTRKGYSNKHDTGKATSAPHPHHPQNHDPDYRHDLSSLATHVNATVPSITSIMTAAQTGALLAAAPGIAVPSASPDCRQEVSPASTSDANTLDHHSVPFPAAAVNTTCEQQAVTPVATPTAGQLGTPPHANAAGGSQGDQVPSAPPTTRMDAPQHHLVDIEDVLVDAPAVSHPLLATIVSSTPPAVGPCLAAAAATASVHQTLQSTLVYGKRGGSKRNGHRVFLQEAAELDALLADLLDEGQAQLTNTRGQATTFRQTDIRVAFAKARKTPAATDVHSCQCKETCSLSPLMQLPVGNHDSLEDNKTSHLPVGTTGDDVTSLVGSTPATAGYGTYSPHPKAKALATGTHYEHLLTSFPWCAPGWPAMDNPAACLGWQWYTQHYLNACAAWRQQQQHSQIANWQRPLGIVMKRQRLPADPVQKHMGYPATIEQQYTADMLQPAWGQPQTSSPLYHTHASAAHWPISTTLPRMLSAPLRWGARKRRYHAQTTHATAGDSLQEHTAQLSSCKAGCAAGSLADIHHGCAITTPRVGLQDGHQHLAHAPSADSRPHPVADCCPIVQQPCQYSLAPERAAHVDDTACQADTCAERVSKHMGELQRFHLSRVLNIMKKHSTARDAATDSSDCNVVPLHVAMDLLQLEQQKPTLAQQPTPQPQPLTMQQESRINPGLSVQLKPSALQQLQPQPLLHPTMMQTPVTRQHSCRPDHIPEEQPSSEQLMTDPQSSACCEFDATAVRSQHRELCKLLHPDKCTLPGAAEAFAAVSAAYKVLTEACSFTHSAVRRQDKAQMGSNYNCSGAQLLQHQQGTPAKQDPVQVKASCQGASTQFANSEDHPRPQTQALAHQQQHQQQQTGQYPYTHQHDTEGIVAQDHECFTSHHHVQRPAKVQQHKSNGHTQTHRAISSASGSSATRKVLHALQLTPALVALLPPGTVLPILPQDATAPLLLLVEVPRGAWPACCSHQESVERLLSVGPVCLKLCCMSYCLDAVFGPVRYRALLVSTSDPYGLLVNTLYLLPQ